jgi:iron complex transport system ATP-binding protein
LSDVIRLEGVTVERDGTAILQNLSWTVRAGENWVLFGPNGAGKTTLLQLLNGYLWPTRGTVEVLGRRLGQVDVRELRRSIALVSDALSGLLNRDLNGLEVIVTGARAHLNLFEPLTTAETLHARDLARLIHAGDLLEKSFSVMSTGERQRILIARALMARPRLVILDEPCAGLDLARREELLRTVTAAARSGTTKSVIFTTHHVEEIAGVFTHALLLSAGTAVAAGPINRVLTSANLTRAFGLPVNLIRRHGRLYAHASI